MSRSLFRGLFKAQESLTWRRISPLQTPFQGFPKTELAPQLVPESEELVELGGKYDERCSHSSLEC
jgi:hypothetical protein